MRRVADILFKVLLPLFLGGSILWWMYRGFDWNELMEAVSGNMRWSWMLLSLPFGVTAQLCRAFRWRQALEPMGEKPRCSTCVNAIFLSYASSLVIPRVGELLRCGVLNRWDKTNFSRSVGTVVCERVVDTLLILLLSIVTILWQIPVFVNFMQSTGVSLTGILARFTVAGYFVTVVCVALIAAVAIYLMFRLHVFSRTRKVMTDLRDGLLSIRLVRNKTFFLLNSLGIWASYYLHFYLTFYCFDETAALGPMAALVAFVVGSFAVLVPTPNGAGPWHFAVKTVLVLYGVAATQAVVFVLVVHTIQTLLVLVLGLYALAALALTKRRG